MKPEQFWLMLGANKEKELVSVLGFSDKTEAEALQEANKRAEPGTEVRIFETMKSDAIAMGTAIQTWLVSFGMSEAEANHIIGELSNLILARDGWKASRTWRESD